MRLLLFAIAWSLGCFFKSQQDTRPVPVDTFEEPPPLTIIEADTAVFAPVETVTRWPSDEDFGFFIGYQKDLKLQMQWRQTCGSFDSDWYDMTRDPLDPLETSYLLKPGIAGDTVIVLAQAMRSFPRSGCIWHFRFRTVSRRSFSDWVTLEEKITLVDPKITQPKIQVIRSGKKETP